jgi:hypothetical protein
MVPTTQWHREFIAHLAAERWALREAQVVSVRWQAAADQTRLLGNEPDVIAVANPPRLGEGKHALVNSFGAPLPSAAWGNARRSWVHTLRSCCPVSQSRCRCRLSVIYGECRQPRSERLLDAVSIVYDEFDASAPSIGVAVFEIPRRSRREADVEARSEWPPFSRRLFCSDRFPPSDLAVDEV